MRINLLLYKWQPFFNNELLIPLNITFGIYLQELLEGSNVKNLVLPIAIYLVWIFIYFVISSIELYFAVEIVKEQNNRGEVPPKKVYKTIIYKSLENIVIGVLIFSLMGVCLISELSKEGNHPDSVGFGYLTVLGSYVFFCLSTVIYKGVKIGESFEKTEGQKDEFFNLIGAFFLILKKWFFDRTINSFNIPKVEDKNKTDEVN